MEAQYYPAGLPVEYDPAGQAAVGRPTQAPNFNSATPRSAWWTDGDGVVATTGARFVRDLQRALGVGSDGNFGPTSATAMRNMVARLAGERPGPVATDVLRNLDALRQGSTTTITPRTLIAAIHIAYYNTPGFSWDGSMESGSSIVRLGTNAMLPNVVPFPYRRAAPGNPNLPPERWGLDAAPPPLPQGAGPTTPGTPGSRPSPPSPISPTKTPGTPSPPGTLGAPASTGMLSRITGAWSRLSTGQKAAIGALGVLGVGVAVVAATSEEPKKAPTPPTGPGGRPLNLKVTVGPQGRLAPPPRRPPVTR